MFSAVPIELTFPATNMGPVPGVSMEVLRRPYGFDTGRVLTWTPPSVMARYVVPGTPVQVKWGAGGGYDGMTGYVHALRPLIEDQQQRTELVITDAASVMSTRNARSFQSMGYSNAAQEIVDDYRLYLESETTTEQFSSLESGTATDWDFLVTMAQASDCVLLGEGTTIIFRSLLKLWQDRAAVMTDANTFSGPMTPNGRLSMFKPDYSIARTEELLDVEETGVAFAIRPPSWASMFPYRADATMIGPFAVRPLDVFRVAERNAARVWTVLSIKHVVDATGYTGVITFGGDGRDYSNRKLITNLLPVSQAMAFNRQGARPSPVLRDYSSVFFTAGIQATGVQARWESDRLVAPGVLMAETSTSGVI